MVDASAVLEALLRLPAAETVQVRLFHSGRTLHAPHLLDAEVAHVLRRYAGNRAIDAERGRGALADLADLPLRRYPHRFLLQCVWEFRHNLGACDALYVGLAEALGGTLLTCDRRLAAAARRYVDIELI